MKEAFELYTEFTESFEVSFDKVGSLRIANVNSAACIKAKNRYNGLHETLKDVRFHASSVENHLRKAGLCSDHENSLIQLGKPLINTAKQGEFN